MSSMMLNPNTESSGMIRGAALWGDIDQYIRAGERARAEYVASAASSAIARFKNWATAFSAESRAQAKAERAARRLAKPEFEGTPSRGLFWPRLSWVAHEGGRWLGILPERQSGSEDQRAA